MITDKFQRDQIDKAKEQMQETIYAHLAALVEESDIEEVFLVLHNVSFDMDKRKELEAKFDEAKKWVWDEKSSELCIL